jgi:hypothetical protein
VYVEAGGQFFATQKNVSDPINVIASCSDSVYKKYGFKRFPTKEKAEMYAKGKA